MRKSNFIIMLFLISMAYINPASMKQESSLSLDQVFPEIWVTSVEILTEKPEENIPILLKVTVENNQTNPVQDAFIRFEASEQIFARPEEEPLELDLLNYSFNIDAKSTETFSIELSIVGGSFLLTSSIYLFDTFIPTSINITSVSVLGPPIGDLTSLQNYVLGITGVVLGTVLIPSIADMFRIKKKKNGNKSE